ncbi:hypothetical protein JO972_16620 [Verrucomicrobiaceae bacterium 5K15]|uniref:Uncharacterized protein n=1 Tax=Oceaniferula flava TaxID=2800421 RepID=A0AAE2VDC3_9BACT|nr:hypothetical protein [Oceaniferula flavus]MBK1856590.1 hypothetical protein [Oceaniferula flavus]MBM1137898.1 hypothetical protein [Oceaniferula flavus]
MTPHTPRDITVGVNSGKNRENMAECCVEDFTEQGASSDAIPFVVRGICRAKIENDAKLFYTARLSSTFGKNKNSMKIRFSVDPKFCGPVSIGTLDLIRLIMDRCCLGLGDAKSLVDRAVFDGETVELHVPRDCDAANLLEDMKNLDGPARVNAEVVS